MLNVMKIKIFRMKKVLLSLQVTLPTLLEKVPKRNIAAMSAIFHVILKKFWLNTQLPTKMHTIVLSVIPATTGRRSSRITIITCTKTILVTSVNLYHMDKWWCKYTLIPHTCSSHVTTEIALLKIKEDWQGIKMLNMWTPKNLQTITNSTSQQQRPQKRHPSSDLVYPNLV